MTNVNFKSRYKIEEILNISPNENLEEIVIILNELTDLGWDYHQWETSKPDFNLEDIIKTYPEYEDANEKIKDKLLSKFIESLPDEFFMESFGNKEHSYLRADRKTILECANANLERAKKMIKCTNHKWKYTHNNGNKTCELCRSFQKCTYEEAVLNYESGNVCINDDYSIYFHNNRNLCDCGNNELMYHKHSMFDKTDYQCAKCLKFHPTKYYLSRTSWLTTTPISKEYEEAFLEPSSDSYIDHRYRHSIFTLGVENNQSLQTKIIRYIKKMYDHFTYVEKNNSFDDFIVWLNPFINEFIISRNVQVITEDKDRLDLKGIIDLFITLTENGLVISYNLVLEKAVINKPTDTEVFKNLFENILSGSDKS